MPKIKFTLDARRGLIEELVDESNIAEFAASGIEKSVYARKDYVDSLVFGSGSGGGGGAVNLSGSNTFGSTSSDVHEFNGSVILNNGITGSLLGTASFASDSDKLDGLDSTAFAVLSSSNIFSTDQIITGSLFLSGAIIQNNQAVTKEYVDNTFVWTRAGTVLSPVTSGDSVLIDIDLGTTGLTVEDVGNNASVSIAPANISVIDTLQQIELDALNSKIIITSDIVGTSAGTGSIEVIDESSNPAILNLNIGGFAVNTDSGTSGQVLTSQGEGSAPIWSTISGGGSLSLTGSNIFGSLSTDTHQFTGSVILKNGITGSLSGSSVISTSLSSSVLTVGHIDFNTTAIAPTFQTGRLYYDQTSGDLQYNTLVSPNSINIGQQTVLKVKNTTNATINKGKLVRISGGQGANPLISTASFENDNNSANTLGMVMNDIADNQFGYVLLEGVLSGLNLDPSAPKSYVAGQVLYLSSSGDYTNVTPIAPKHAVRLGEIIQAHQNQGVAFIRVQNGYELNELHDLLITSPANGDLVKYNSSTNVWENTKNLSGSYQLTGSLFLSGTINQNNQVVSKEYVDNIAAGKIDGSISDSEIAFGVGSSISGDANFSWNASSDTLTITSINQALKVNHEIDGEFLNINTTDYSINIIDPITPGGNSVTITPFDVAIGDGGISSGNLTAGVASVTDNGTSNTLSLSIPSGNATIKSVDNLSILQPLNLEINELKVNSNSGTTGQFLTSQGTGFAPIWTTAAPSAPTGVIFVSKNGNNNNSGSLESPVLTIANAISKIKSHVSGAANANRGVVLVAPGTYSENIIIEDKNVIISGLTNDKEDQAVNIVGSIKIYATGSRGGTLDSVGIHNIKINDIPGATSHLISLTGSAPNANGIFLTLQNVLVAKVNSAPSNASGLFIDTSYANRVRINDCRFLDQSGGGSPLVHFKRSGASALIDIYDTKFECSVASSNHTAGPLIKTDGSCYITAIDRCIFDTNSLSGAINIGAVNSLGSSLNISNSSIITTNTGSNGIKIPVNTSIVSIRNVFTVTGTNNICISGSSGYNPNPLISAPIGVSNNIATPSVPSLGVLFSTSITGSITSSYVPI